MNSIKILFILITMTMTINMLIGQGNDPEERLKSQKIAFITQKLDLSPDESAKFWPLYNQMESEMKTLREKNMEKQSSKTMTDAQANDFINNSFRMREEELAIEKKHIEKFKTALPVQKVAQLMILERDFRKEMVASIKERIKDRKKAGRG